jgi:peptide/nickel transport system ATP-binding protein
VATEGRVTLKVYPFRGDRGAEATRARLATIDGTVPNLAKLSPGCRFAARCAFKADICAQDPPLVEIEPGHFSACWFAGLVAEAAS